jgi:hypothetical protein
MPNPIDRSEMFGVTQEDAAPSMGTARIMKTCQLDDKEIFK